jgi:hypothetical protein
MLKNMFAAGIFLMVFLPATSSPAGVYEGASPNADTPATARAASPASPAATAVPMTAPASSAKASTADHAARIASNFGTLMGKNWTDIAWFLGKLIFNAIMWAAMLLIVGIIAGLASYFICRRLGLVKAPWKWYRYVAWLWVVLFIFSGACGFAYGGCWVGAGKTVKNAINRDFVLDKVISHMILAVMMDRADYQATGQESAEQIQKVFADSEALRRLSMQDWQESAANIRKSAGDSAVRRWLLDLAMGQGLDKLANELQGLDPRAVYTIVYSSPNIDAYMKQHPDASPGIVMISHQLATARQKACLMVDKAVLSPLVLGIFLGLLGPIAMGGLFRLIVWLATRGQAASPPSGAA